MSCPVAALLLGAVQVVAQPPPAAVAHPPTPADPDAPKVDPAAFERGKQLMVNQCGFCHGSNARGGAGGARSHAIGPRAERRGRQAARRVPQGRPPRAQHAEVRSARRTRSATWPPSSTRRSTSVSDRGKYKILDILVGDPKAGEAYFNGRRRLHLVPLGDRGLQGRGREVRGRGDAPATRVDAARAPATWAAPAGGREIPPFLEPTAVKATVKQPSGESFTGPLLRLTDFDVTVYDTERATAAHLAAPRRLTHRDPHRSAASAHRPVAQVDGRRPP